MIDLKDYINESLLDDFDDIADKIDDNPFSLILNSKSENEFMEAVDNLCRLCDKIDIADANQKKYKNSFFLSNAHYMNGKPMGIVVDKMLKKSSKAMLIRSIYNLTTGDDGSKWVYYANEKIDINYEEDVNSKWDGNFGTYLLQDLYILPKYLEKFYLDIVKKLRPLQELYYNINYGERVSGERLVKKIS